MGARRRGCRRLWGLQVEGMGPSVLGSSGAPGWLQGLSPRDGDSSAASRNSLPAVAVPMQTLAQGHPAGLAHPSQQHLPVPLTMHAGVCMGWAACPNTGAALSLDPTQPPMHGTPRGPAAAGPALPPACGLPAARVGSPSERARPPSSPTVSDSEECSPTGPRIRGQGLHSSTPQGPDHSFLPLLGA